jgi:outer membrane protein OmpA-like peptidoglycan-associated protein
MGKSRKAWGLRMRKRGKSRALYTRILCALTFCILAPLLLRAVPMLPGSEWQYAGAGAHSLTGGGWQESVFDVLRNPAALATNTALLIGATYGALGTGDTQAGLGLSLPEDFGVLTFNLLFTDVPSALETNMSAGSGFMAKGSFSKRITPNFHFGIGLGFLAASRSPDAELRGGAHLDLGFLLLQNGTVRELEAAAEEKDFGFFDRVFSFSFNNLGFNPSWDGWKEYPDIHALAGLSFNFFKSKEVTLGTSQNFAVTFDTLGLRYSGGIDIGLFDLFHIRAGLHLGNGDLGPFTLGAGIDLRHSFDSFGFDISWAMVPFSHSGKNEVGHFLTLNLTFGSGKKDPPKPNMTSRLRAFSPNNDGVQDTTVFDISLQTAEEIEGWEITIKNTNANLVRRIRSQEDDGNGLSISKFFTILFSSHANISIPAAWEWDGGDDAGKILPDGTYFYQIKVWDVRGEEYFSVPKQVDIRTEQPGADVNIKLTLFSPNRGGGRDHLIVEQTLTGRDVRWTGYMANANGNTVRTFSWGNKPPSQFEWDGRDDSGKIVSDGNYEYIIEGSDNAGNSVRKKVSGIVISTRKRAVGVKASADMFAPTGKGIFDTIRFTPAAETHEMLENWTLEITSPEGALVKSYAGSAPLPAELAWDGRGNDATQLPDGVYAYALRAEYADGDAPKTQAQQVRILTRGPAITLTAAPRLFAPDDSTENKNLRITLRFQEHTVISNWKITVKNNDKIFKTFSGANPKQRDISILWNGVGDAGEIVESAATYTIEASAADILENTGSADPVQIDIDILVIKTARGLKILITSIEFEYNRWELSSPESPVLNRVSDVLKRYPEYKIIIEGHTDSIGDVEYNLMLSTRRARTVLRYLTRRGIDDRRMLAKGLGMSVPIASNATAEGRAKNRRVEFILVKDE